MFNKKLFAVVVGALLCQNIFAANNKLSDYDSGFYVGVLGGFQRTTLDVGNPSITYHGATYQLSDFVKTQLDKGKLAGGFFLGYSFCPYFSVDAGYAYYPNNKITLISIIPGEVGQLSYKYAVHAINLMPKAILPLEKVSSELAGWSLYGKLGPVLAVTTLSDNTTNKLQNGSWGVKLGYALGVGYNFTDHFAVDFSWSGIYSNDKLLDSIKDAYATNSKQGIKYVPSVMLFALSLSYKF